MKKDIKEFLKTGPKIVMISKDLKLIVERKDDKEQILCLFNPFRSNFADALDRAFTSQKLGEVMHVMNFHDVSMGFIIIDLPPVSDDSKILVLIKKELDIYSEFYHVSSHHEKFLEKYRSKDSGFVYYE